MPYYIKHTPDYFHYTVGLMTLPQLRGLIVLLVVAAAEQIGEAALFVVNYSSSLLFLITIAAPAAVIRTAILAIMLNGTG